MKQEEAVGLFTLAGIPVLNIWELPNGYWPNSYYEERKNSPWWLIKTPRGCIKIGWRKRVISINWEDTDIREVITEDDVTKDKELVHASSNVKALEYLSALGYLMRQKEVLDPPAGLDG